jgi:uncharacterized protein involved in exopolysaccharide biosynthesis
MTPQPDPDGGASDLEVEQEIDFGRYWNAIVARWWLPVTGLIIGAFIGFLVSLGGSSTYKATSQVYLGQPLSPSGAAQVTSAPTSLGLVTNLVTSESSVREVAARAGMKPGKLRGHIQTKALTGITGAKLGTPAPLLAITVQGASRHKIALAANALAEIVVQQVSGYATSKIQTLKQELSYDRARLRVVNQRLATAQQSLAGLASDKSVGATDKFLIQNNLNSIIATSLQTQNLLSQDLFQVQQELSLAQDVEVSRIVSPAEATRTAGPSKRTGALVGALIGLVLGLLAALLWEPVGERVRSRPRPA